MSFKLARKIAPSFFKTISERLKQGEVIEIDCQPHSASKRCERQITAIRRIFLMAGKALCSFGLNFADWKENEAGKYLYDWLDSRGAGGCCNAPFRIFPRAVFAFSPRLPFGQFTYPLSRYSGFYEKKNLNFCREKVGGGGGGCNNSPILRGKGW